jgi:hypothetical protein
MSSFGSVSVFTERTEQMLESAAESGLAIYTHVPVSQQA